MKILVTGGAGFIGSHVIKALLDHGEEVISIDDFNDYYDVSLKENRILPFKDHPQFQLYRNDICDFPKLKTLFEEHTIDKICHLAARAGVRASIQAPFLYERVNIMGTMNLLELARDYKVKNFVFASTSSVYGGNTKIPFTETDQVDRPISPYAATKKAGELLCYTYHHLYELSITCLRFFTVYGPCGRPDMALFKFAKAIEENRPIDVYNFGKMKRDFTYIEDIVNGVVSALDKELGYEIINLGNSHAEDLEYFIQCIEKELEEKAIRNYIPIQPGDVPETYADITKAKKLLHFEPKTHIEEGIKKFIEWYKDYNGHVNSNSI